MGEEKRNYTHLTVVEIGHSGTCLSNSQHLRVPSSHLVPAWTRAPHSQQNRLDTGQTVAREGPDRGRYHHTGTSLLLLLLYYSTTTDNTITGTRPP